MEEPSASEAESPLSQENAPAADPAVPVSAPTSTLACPLPADGSGADSSPVKRRGKAGLVVLGVGAAVVIAVVVLLVQVLPVFDRVFAQPCSLRAPRLQEDRNSRFTGAGTAGLTMSLWSRA